ncbi:MAG: DUF3987 domain-containing protein [Phycisphaerae bacterium]|nr:DUF3987 domain-containing protein [Phycisphaerae bacterium]
MTRRLLDARAGGNGALTKNPTRLDETPSDDTKSGGFGYVEAVSDPDFEWQALPEDALPVGLREIVQHGAKALGVDPALVALPGLAVLATCIGTTRALLLQRSWIAYSILWAATVLRSGGRKSPAQELVLDPLSRLQLGRLREYELALERYEADSLQYKTALGDWGKGKPGARGEPPAKPEEPIPIRYLTSDTTIEALAWLLQSNRRGVGVFNDELAGFLKSFDAYKSKGGGDAARWLELHRAGTLVVDRKHGNPKTIYVPRAAVTIAGTVQPGTLQRLLTPEYFENGLAARFIFAAPPEKPRRYVEADIPKHAQERYTELLRRLLALDHQADEQGELGPKLIRLSPEAKALWVAWVDEIGARIDAALDDDVKAFLSKAEELPARLALIDHCTRIVSSPDIPEDVLEADSMRRGIDIARWASLATLNVYAGLREPEGKREGRKLLTWVQAHGGKCTARDVVRGVWRYRGDPQGAKLALDALVNDGLGQWDWSSGPGRPTAVFRITLPHRHSETPNDGPESEGFVESTAGNETIGTTAWEPLDVLPEECTGADPPSDYESGN